MYWYRIINNKQVKRSLIKGSIIQLMLVIIFLLFATYVFTNYQHTKSLFFMSLLIFFLVILIMLFITLITIINRILFKKRGHYIYEVCIENNGLLCRDLNGNIRVYPFSIFNNNVWVRVEASRSRTLTFWDFLNHGAKYIEGEIKDRPLKEKMIISLLFFRCEKIKPNKHLLTLNLSLSVIDLKTINKMLTEWREKYEAYLKREGIYEEVMKEMQEREVKPAKEREKKEHPERARIHFYVLVLVIIFAIISFVFLALIPYMNTPTDSPDYDYRLAYLIIDGFLTFSLVFIGIIKLPRLWSVV